MIAFVYSLLHSLFVCLALPVVCAYLSSICKAGFDDTGQDLMKECMESHLMKLVRFSRSSAAVVRTFD